MEDAMAVAWRSTCSILLLVVSFQLATIVHAQTDYSFARWFTAAGRAVPDTVRKNAQPAPKKKFDPRDAILIPVSIE